MDFRSIKYTEKSGVALAWTLAEEHGTVESSMEGGENPAPSFVAALAAIKGFVVTLLELPAEWAATVSVTGVSLSETKDRRPQLIVHARRPISGANDTPLFLNTPLVREATEENPTAGGTYGNDVAALIDSLIAEAVRYVQGEREQTELMDPAETTKRERKSRGRAKDGYEQQNSAGAPLSNERIRAGLLRYGRDVPIDAIATWTSTERDQAMGWAHDQARFRDGLITDAGVRAEPECLKRDATPALLEDQVKAIDDAPQRMELV